MRAGSPLAAVVAASETPSSTAELIRRSTAAPLLLLTGAEPAERATCVQLGADVCLRTDEDPQVITAHLDALLRHRRHEGAPLGQISIGDLLIDVEGRRVSVKGREIQLSPREFDLLAHFAANHGRVRRRYDLLDAVWGVNFVGEQKTVDVHVAWLRQKVPPEAGVRITTLRGVGYRLDLV